MQPFADSLGRMNFTVTPVRGQLLNRASQTIAVIVAAEGVVVLLGWRLHQGNRVKKSCCNKAYKMLIVPGSGFEL
jgi:hypothetical protein